MTLESLIAEYHVLADDRAGEAHVSDPQLWAFFAEAESEAAIRGRLIHEASDSALCQIAVVSGTSVYSTHPALFEVTYVAFEDADGERTRVRLVSAEALDPDEPVRIAADCYDAPTLDDWRTDTGTPAVAIQSGTSIRLVPTPDAAGTLYLEGYRTPLGALGSDPEIAEAHHRHLIQWVLYRAFALPYAPSVDPKLSATSYANFERYFGRRPDSDLRNDTRRDIPLHVKAHWV